MRFSTLYDAVDLARAEGALDAAWREVKDNIPLEEREKARTKLAYIVASCALFAGDHAELARRAVARFKKGRVRPRI